jgi:LuxR family maltose regulon positive regulatory protein
VPTKLAPPQVRPGLLTRERLLARLGVAPTTRLTLLVAPAGFGKSTLTAQ